MIFLDKIRNMDWFLMGLICALGFCGILMMYSVAGSNFTPWALKQMGRFFIGICGILILSAIDIRTIYKSSWFLYGVSILLLLGVQFFGTTGMGAKRWINLYVLQLQPSELAKIFTVLVLAHFYSTSLSHRISSMTFFGFALIIIILPSLLVLKQPDLGTAILIMVGGIVTCFLAGVSWKWFAGGAITITSVIPFIWMYGLHSYQKKRISTFLNPENDPLGSGYHIMQSKIAIGSGGMTGRGYTNGTQSNLGFLPENHTDFIFTVVAEEFGFFGATFILLLSFLIVYRIFTISWQCKNKFAKLLSQGIGVTFFLYVLINTGMVMGLFPIVGVPFPLLSYGGTVMLTMMMGFGFVQNAWVHRHIEAPHSNVEQY